VKSLPQKTLLAATLAMLVGVTGCSRAEDEPEPATSVAESEEVESPPAEDLRLGYFANVTHASAIIGVNEGLFEAELGDTTLTTQTFNAGPDVIGALLGGSIDMSFIGPGPTISGFTESDGEALRLISGATSGGAQLVVREGIESPEDLAGTTIATPQLGNTQDVALKKWLSEEGIEKDTAEGVTVQNVANSDSFALFQAGDIDGGWLPEPWSSRYVEDAGGGVLLDEADLWDNGVFPTTIIIVRTEFLEEFPSTVEAFLRGQIAAVQFAEESPDEAKTIVNAGLEELTGAPLSDVVLDRAFENITLTFDPAAANFIQLAEDAVTAEVAEEAVDLKGLVDLGPLNRALEEAGLDTVDAGGLDAG